MVQMCPLVHYLQYYCQFSCGLPLPAKNLYPFHADPAFHVHSDLDPNLAISVSANGSGSVSFECGPQVPKYSIGAVLNFFENLRKYSRINVYHRC